MKKATLIFAFIACSFVASAQHSTGWTISANASTCMLNNDRLLLSKIAVEPGFQWNEKWYIGLSFSYVENMKFYFPQGEKFKGMMNSISAYNRLLEPMHKLSPMIGLEIGNIFFSNARGTRIGQDFVIGSGPNHEMMGTFRSFTSFARLKFMLDIQLGDANFRFGPNFNIATVSMYEVYQGRDFSNLIHGFGIEGGLLYSIGR